MSTAVVIGIGIVPGEVAGAEPLGGAGDRTLPREPLLTPSEIGDGVVDGLQYADPTEGLALVEPPSATSDGGAHLTYPLVIPKGRGIAPDLSLSYDSGGENGWVGLGWDLSVGEIAVDTGWGAPHFDPAFESETYLLDGDMLVPNALGDAWQPRLPGTRQDYTRKVETEHDLIIRHEIAPGGPGNYFWEVRDKMGGIRWYGGQPDDGGPIAETEPAIDRSAIVLDGEGNAVRWLLSAERDVGVNLIRYSYQTVVYANGANGWVENSACVANGPNLCAQHTFLSTIEYTAGATKSGEPEDPPYQVAFLRDSDINPTAPLRADPFVDASGGYVDLMTDRLARVEVNHGAINQPDQDQPRLPRTYDELAVRYDLGYITGPFGKSLLSTVSQVGNDATTSATHTFEYVNKVTDANGAYTGNGFGADADVQSWNTGSDLPDRVLLDSDVSIGALGSSEGNSGEGHAYIGFNPISPTKVGSFGGAIQIGGGATESLAEWIDLNGDGLPDKVYRDPTGNDIDRNGPILYRLNQGGPGGSTAFGDTSTATGINKLSTEGNFALELSVQAFPVVTIAFGLGVNVSWGDAYFSDVNSDGLPDFIQGGQVYFNHLVDGVPTFELGSGNTSVPILDAVATAPSIPEVDEIEADLIEQSPLVDTVRRWTAPFDGTVSVDAPVTLAPDGGSSLDGVRVAIQHDNVEVGAANLLTTGSAAFGTPLDIEVDKGDQIYFRVGSVNDGTKDEVTWSPEISYTAIDGVTDVADVELDVNGLSQTSYAAAADFTKSGRPGSQVIMPYTGQVRFSSTVTKTSATSDDLRLVLLHNGVAVPGSAVTIPAAYVGDTDLSNTFNVAGPVIPSTPGGASSQDTVSVQLATDSPIDLNAVSWEPSLRYLSAQNSDGDPITVVNDGGDPTIVIDMLPDIEQYPNRSSASVSEPWTPVADATYDAIVSLGLGANTIGGTAVVLVKTRNGVVARQNLTIPATLLPTGFSAEVEIDAALAHDEEYWFDVTVRDPALSDTVTLSGFALRPDGETTGDNDITVPGVLHWTGRQGVFPLAYRGWAVAGYNGNGAAATAPIDASAFVIDPNELPQQTEAPTGFNDPNYDPPAPERSFAYLPGEQQSLAVPGQPTDTTPVWKGSRDNLSASPERMRSSRLGGDTASIGDPAGGNARAVTRIGITAPSAALAFGIGPLTASFGVSPSFGLQDFDDMNGDGYPDVITPNSVQYTSQRGAYLPTASNPGQLAVSNQDLTFAVGAGFGSGLVDIKGNAKGKTNSTKSGGAAGKGDDADDSGGGVEIGVGISASWTNPNTSEAPLVQGDGPSTDRSTYGDQLDQVPGDTYDGTAPIQQALADVNGDGLNDRVFANPSGVFAYYNLGYRFADDPVAITTGGFESQESYTGGLSLGFSTPWADFSGGVALNWNVDLARYAWRDVNGDGIVDQIHKANNTDTPTVRFGTGAGLLPPVTYGEMFTAQVAGIDTGQQASLDRATGLGGQFDFTIAIGPLCLVACYLIINPGASYQNSVSTTEVELEDVNGDGFADSLSSLDDDALQVRLNTQADTNLLATVRNPLGGTVSMEYTRAGNTVDHPDSVWTMAKVDVDDGRPGDGVDVTQRTYAYDGLKTDKLHREPLGFATVTETEVDVAAGTGLRTTTYEYLNDNVFVSGLLESVRVTDAQAPPDNNGVKGVDNVWALRSVLSGGDPVPVGSSTGLTGVESLQLSMAPLVLQTEELVFDSGNQVGQSTRTEFEYDLLGNVALQSDLGELEDPNDDVVAAYVYSDCTISAQDDGVAEACDLQVSDPPDRVSPFWNSDRCPTWVSQPAVFTITNGKTGAAEIVYRQRDGSPDICTNQSVTYLEETIGDGEVGVTQLAYDHWGSYNRIVYPVGENGRRYSVFYEWDPDRHSDIAVVTEYDLTDEAVEAFLDDFEDTGFDGADYTEGLTSSAEFDPFSGKVSRRIDANDNSTWFDYDPLGRIASIRGPAETRPVDPLIEYGYSLDDPRVTGDVDAYALAQHEDVFNPGDTIDTATFVDGIGRVVQTKRDASLFVAANQPKVTGRIVSGATTYDALGHAVSQYRPTVDTKADIGTYEDSPLSGLFTTTEWDLWDLPNVVTEPGDRVTTVEYGYGKVNPSDPVTMYETTETAPNGRQTITYTDIRDVVHAEDDAPMDAARLRTAYDHDGLGQLLRVVDSAGNETTHDYDLLGRRLSTETPDGGLVEYAYDADGQQTSKVTPNLRALDQEISYSYDLHRLTGIDHPDGTPDVSYEYGGPDETDINGAGQIVRLEDGARILTSEYSPAGNVTKQTAEMKLNNWENDPDADKSRFQWAMEWSYDGLGRLDTVTYPDPDDDPLTNSEVVSYGYDAGGLVSSITGEELGYVTVGSTRRPQLRTYEYLRDRQYDVFLRTRFDRLGNGATTEYTFDDSTLWLTRQQTISPRPKARGAANKEIQDLNYTYDQVGNPLTYNNALPPKLQNLMGGPTTQAYTYDPYERIVGASGQWLDTGRTSRTYSLGLEYDDNANVVAKEQTDLLNTSTRSTALYPTTYTFERGFTGSAPHQADGAVTTGNQVVEDTYDYDLNGNLTRMVDDTGRVLHDIEWDATDRMRRITIGAGTTEYFYDDTGQRAIERSPFGEKAFVNPWLDVVAERMWKYVWAGDDRLAVQLDDGGRDEVERYWLHKDLQGSTNVVTDRVGDTWQHQEYFPSGEAWIEQKGEQSRTPYQFAGAYFDEHQQLSDFGARWYDQKREMFYSPDPVLTDDPTAMLGAPALRAAYAYAGSNPLAYVDPGGRQFTKAQARSFIKANQDDARRIIRNDPKLRAQLEQNLQTSLPRGLVRLGLDIEKAESRQKVVEAVEDFFVPLVEINVSTGEVKLGLFVKPAQWTVREGSDGSGAAAAAPAGATGATGGPNVPNQAAPQASANVSPGSSNAPVANAATATPSTTAATTRPPPKPLPKPPAKAKGDL